MAVRRPFPPSEHRSIGVDRNARDDDDRNTGTGTPVFEGTAGAVLSAQHSSRNRYIRPASCAHRPERRSAPITRRRRPAPTVRHWRPMPTTRRRCPVPAWPGRRAAESGSLASRKRRRRGRGVWSTRRFSRAYGAPVDGPHPRNQDAARSTVAVRIVAIDAGSPTRSHQRLSMTPEAGPWLHSAKAALKARGKPR